MEIKRKLSISWGINELKVIPTGKGFFHVLLFNLKDQCTALSSGLLALKPGVMRFSRWVPGFSSMNQSSILQVWIRIHNLPLEFRKSQNLFNWFTYKN